jgi:hypothetical protein
MNKKLAIRAIKAALIARITDINPESIGSEVLFSSHFDLMESNPLDRAKTKNRLN